MLKYPIPKDRRIKLAKLYFHLSITPGLPMQILATCADAFKVLTRSKRKMSIEDMRLPWKPIYDILKQDLFLTRRQFEYTWVVHCVKRFLRHWLITAVQSTILVHGVYCRQLSQILPSCRNRWDADDFPTFNWWHKVRRECHALCNNVLSAESAFIDGSLSSIFSNDFPSVDPSTILSSCVISLVGIVELLQIRWEDAILYLEVDRDACQPRSQQSEDINRSSRRWDIWGRGASKLGPQRLFRPISMARAIQRRRNIHWVWMEFFDVQMSCFYGYEH